MEDGLFTPVKNKQKKKQESADEGRWEHCSVVWLQEREEKLSSLPDISRNSFFFSLNEGQVALKMVSVIGFCADVVQMYLRCTSFFCFLCVFFSVSAVKKKIPTCYFHNLVCPCGKGGGKKRTIM